MSRADAISPAGVKDAAPLFAALGDATRLGLLLAHKADVWVLTETHSDLDLSPEYTSSTTTPRNSLSQGLSQLTPPSPGRYPASRTGQCG